MRNRVNGLLVAGLFFGASALFGPSVAFGQMVETAAVSEGSNAQKPPKPVIFLAGQVQPGSVTYTKPDLRVETVELENGLSLGATGQIPLMRHFYVGACLDYNRVKPFTSLFSWTAELVGDLKIVGPLRFQGGVGVGYSILHGSLQSFDKDYQLTRVSGRLLYQPPMKIGCVLEYVRWNPTEGQNSHLDALSGFRIGVVF